MLIFDFRCEDCDLVDEYFVYKGEEIVCKRCESKAMIRKVPVVRLDRAAFWRAGMPSGDTWHKARIEKQKMQARSKKDHGTYGSQKSVWDNTIPEGYERNK